MSLLALSTSTDLQIGDNPVVSIGLDIEYQGSSISLSYARSELPYGIIYFGRSPSLSEPADSTDLGGRLSGTNGRVEFRCAVMSREHASLTFGDDGKVYLRDLPACHHGTTLTRGNTEVKLTKMQPYQLSDGDKITFGKPVHKGGVVHEPLHAIVRLAAGQEKPQAGSGRYRLSSPDLYTDDDFGREVTPPWRKDFGDFANMIGEYDLEQHSHQATQSAYSIDEGDEDEDEDDDEDDDSVVEFIPSSALANPPSNYSSPATVTKSPVHAEIIDLTREMSPIHSPCFEVIDDSETEDMVFSSQTVHPMYPAIQGCLDVPFMMPIEVESPQPVRKPDIEHLLNDGADEPKESSVVADDKPQDCPAVEMTKLQNDLAEIKKEMQQFRIHRVKTKHQLSLNQTTTEANIQVLENGLKAIEDRLDTSLFADNDIHDGVDIALSAVADLANDVEDGRNEILDMLTETRDLRAECARMMKAEVENIEAIRKTSELALKRKFNELENSDVITNEELSSDSISMIPANVSVASEEPLPKRQKVLPSFGGVNVSQFILGAIAGSIGTVMALAFTGEE